MTEEHNPSAFPIPHSNEPGAYPTEPGMTLRDHFAGQLAAAMAPTVMNAAREGHQSAQHGAEALAVAAYRMADVMLVVRNREDLTKVPHVPGAGLWGQS